MLVAILAACGDNITTCPAVPFAEGDATGHLDPLGSSPTEARAGRVKAEDLPDVPSGLITWKAGDFVIANDKIALVIEDAGDSDLYDPWGGRPVGLARIDHRSGHGKMIQPANFGEMFLLTGRSTVVTESVTVINDGSDGGTAIIRARGKLHPLPFFEAVIAVVYNEQWLDIDAAIDYELAPGAEAVDVRYRYHSPRTEAKDSPSTMHAFMYTKRTPIFQPDKGFDETISKPYLAFVDDAATSWAYMPGDGVFNGSLAVSGFVGAFTPGFTMQPCGETSRLHARIAIGGPGLDGAVAAASRTLGIATRTITGTVMRDGNLYANVHVHATDPAGNYLSRALTTPTGDFTLTVPVGADVTLTAFRRGDALATAHVPPSQTSGTIVLPLAGAIRVVATDKGVPAPVRVQILPAPGQTIPMVPASFGEAPITAGRQQIVYATGGDATIDVPAGTWQVIVSRGYEYELVQQTVTVAAGGRLTLTPAKTVSVRAPEVARTVGVAVGVLVPVTGVFVGVGVLVR